MMQPPRSSARCGLAILVLAWAVGCATQPSEPSVGSEPAPGSAEPTPSPSDQPPLRATGVEHPGCLLVQRLSDGSTVEAGAAEACDARTVPASTFKIPHALIALQTGVIADPEHEEKWDGVETWNEAWHRDHDLASAIRHSVVWYFQRTARKIGRERMQTWLTDLDYGNAKVEGPIDAFWLDGGSLTISGDEQLDFMVRMFGRRLPIDGAHVDRVIEAMHLEGSDLVWRLPAGTAEPELASPLHAKSGTAGDDRGSITWWAGRVEHEGEAYVFVSRVRDPATPPGAYSPAIDHGLRALRTMGLL